MNIKAVRYLCCADTVLVLALAFGSQFLAAQAISGDVVGTVRDNSGAAISAVQLRARMIETGVVTTTVTNDHGEFHFVNLLLCIEAGERFGGPFKPRSHA
jgi:hypothetical protein